MKTNKILMMAAAAALLFAACDKDEEEGSNANNNNNSAIAEAADNTLVFDGTVYPLVAEFNYPNNAMGWLNVHSADTNADGQYLIRVPEDWSDIHLYADMVGFDIDLTAPYNEWPGYHFGLEGLVNFQFSASDEGSSGSVEGDEYPDSTPFSSGTLKVTVANDVFTYTIAGRTKNNHTISLRLVTPANGWQPAVD